MGVFDGIDGQQVGDKAKEKAREAGEGLSHLGHSIWHKAKDVANSDQVNLAGHATREALGKLSQTVSKLDLSHNPLLNDRDLGAVSGLRTLTHLDLGFNNKITDQGLNVLRDKNNLKHLNLENTLITGAAMALVPHAALVSLVLRNDKNITDAALPHLKRMTGLKELDLRGTGLTEHAVTELKKSLPHAQIRH
jgi:hypothetical protein